MTEIAAQTMIGPPPKFLVKQSFLRLEAMKPMRRSLEIYCDNSDKNLFQYNKHFI